MLAVPHARVRHIRPSAVVERRCGGEGPCPSTVRADPYDHAVTTQSPLAPFVLDEADATQTSHCLMLFEGDMEQVEAVFEEHDAEGNGHGWEGLAESLVHTQMPELADRLDFGSESGTFVVTSDDITALRQLGDVLHGAFHDRELLARHIQGADPIFLPR